LMVVIACAVLAAGLLYLAIKLWPGMSAG